MTTRKPKPARIRLLTPFHSAFPYDTGLIGRLKFPDNRYEIFAFCAEAYSLALGRQPEVGGFDAELDMNLVFHFGDSQNSSHSAQFMGTNALRHNYYHRLLDLMLFAADRHWQFGG